MDDLVDVVDRDAEALEDVDAVLRLLEEVLRAARDDLDAVVDEALEEELEAHPARRAAVEREHVRREVRLELREAVEVVEDHIGLGVGLDGDDDVHAHHALGVVLDVGNALDLVILDQFAEVDEHLTLVDAVRQLGDDDLLAPVLLRDDFGLCADLERGAAGDVHLADGGAPADDGARGEVGALDELHEVVDRAVGMVDLPLDGVAEFGEVVRGNVRRHADGDARRAVQEEVRYLRGEDGWLLVAAVVGGHHVDGVLVDVLAEVLGELAHADLGVARGCGAVAVDVAEVAVAVDEAVAHREGLGQTDDGVVDRGVAVRVVLAHDLADDGGGLAVLLRVGDAHAAHAVDGAAVHGLHAVARVGERAADDDGHRVVEVRLLHFVLDLDRLDLLDDGRLLRGLRLFRRLLGGSLFVQFFFVVVVVVSHGKCSSAASDSPLKQFHLLYQISRASARPRAKLTRSAEAMIAVQVVRVALLSVNRRFQRKTFLFGWRFSKRS